MKLPFLLLADYANTTTDGKLNVMGIFSRIKAPSFPVRHPSMFLVAKLELELGDLDQIVNLTIKLEDSDGNEVHGMPFSFPIARNAEGVRPDANIIIQLTDTVVPRQGDYQVCVYRNGELMGTADFAAEHV